MPRYMLQFSYTPQAWGALAKNPTNRRPQVEGMMKKLGGRLVDLYYHFGDFDGTAIVEAPDDATAFAAVIAAVTPGHIKTTRTTRLLTVEETIEAMKKAGTVSLPAPG
jgi:uncharacterized protein with GYD domain